MEDAQGGAIWEIDMDITISEETLKKTTKCEKNFSCLSSEKRDVCKATTSVMESMVYIDCLEEVSCLYRHSFGTSGIVYVCECPVRVELCKKHGI